MVFANSLMQQKYLCFKIFRFKSYFFAVIKRNAGCWTFITEPVEWFDSKNKAANIALLFGGKKKCKTSISDRQILIKAFQVHSLSVFWTPPHTNLQPLKNRKLTCSELQHSRIEVAEMLQLIGFLSQWIFHLICNGSATRFKSGIRRTENAFNFLVPSTRI